MQALLALLETRIGLDPASLGARAIQAAVRTRMQALRGTSEAAYLKRVQRDPAEFDQLIEELVVSETWFLRDRVPFEELARLASERLARGQSLRVLSLPCATGEEPYSIALVLHEVGIRYEIDAIDLSPRAIATAVRGIYAARSFRGDGETRFRPWLTREREGDRISATLRDHVHFRVGNVLDPTLLSGARYDLIFCRNMLIYLEREAKTRALSNLKRALNPGGTLFAGHAEALHVMDPRFVRVGTVGAFSYQLRGESQPDQVETRRERAKHEPTGPVRFRSVPPQRSLLDEARGQADRGLLDGARATCTRHLAQHELDADGHALLGVIEQARGALDAAVRSFERTLYLAPEHDEALAHLRLLYERTGQHRAAEALIRRIERRHAQRGER